MKNTFSKILVLSFILFLGFNQVSTAQEIEEEKIFVEVDESPRFPGCDSSYKSIKELNGCSTRRMLEFIYGNMSYPAEARKEKIEGQVVIQFVIKKDGSISNINAVRKVEGGCTEAAIEVVQKMAEMDKKWIPGKKDGKAVAVKYTLPVKFKLEKK